MRFGFSEVLIQMAPACAFSSIFLTAFVFVMWEHMCTLLWGQSERKISWWKRAPDWKVADFLPVSANASSGLVYGSLPNQPDRWFWGWAQGIFYKALCQLFAILGSHCAAVIPNRMMEPLSREQISAKLCLPDLVSICRSFTAHLNVCWWHMTHGQSRDVEFGCHSDGNSMKGCPEQSRMLTATIETCLIYYQVTSGTHQMARRTVFSNLKLVMAHCIFLRMWCDFTLWFQ